MLIEIEEVGGLERRIGMDYLPTYHSHYGESGDCPGLERDAMGTWLGGC